MPDHTAPNVPMEEIERGPRPIAGVATSTAAFLGESDRGPVEPMLILDFSDYQRHFGEVRQGRGYLEHAVQGFFENGGRRAYIARIAGTGATAASRTVAGLKIEAVGPGAWGNRVFVRLGPGSGSGTAASNRFRLQVAYWDVPAPDGGYPDPFAPVPGSSPAPAAIVEDYDGLAWDDPDAEDFYLRRLEDRSTFVKLSVTGAGQLDARPDWPLAALSGGSDGAAPTADDYRGEHADPALRTGLAALAMDPYREISLVVAPAAAEPVASAVIDHCERDRFRFAILDIPEGQADARLLDPRADRESSYAAIYWPWIRVRDGRSGELRLVPPSGHVAGLYARTDATRGVWKAPANDVLNGVLGLERDIDNETQEILNPRGVNAIRRFPGRGIRVWGARTISSSPLWKYVSVRRLFIFLEQSIYDGTQWVVFEPNDERLWERVRDTIRLFLRSQWRNGALVGITENEAFHIACDRTTMTQDDIVNGRLICEIGVAPVRPAEFVIFRIYQSTAEAQR